MIRSVLSTGIAIIIAVSSPTYAQWISKADALKKRSEVTSVVYNGKLYAFLGFKDSSLRVEQTSEVYDPVNDTWSLLKAIPSGKEVTHQGVVIINDNVWHIGGRVGQAPGPLTNEIWIYNITTDSWSQGPSIVDPATGNAVKWAAGGAALLGRTLHIFGGFIIDACNHDQDQYHFTLDIDEWLAGKQQPANWKNVLSPLPIKRNHFGTAVLGGKIYVLGGQFGHDCGGGQDKSYSHVYDPATNIWTQLPTLSTDRSHIEGGTFAMDGKIFLVAGQASGGGNTNRVTIFDPKGNNGAGKWYDDNNLALPSNYEGISAKAIGNTFIIDHGGEFSSQGCSNTTYSRTITRNPVYEFGFSAGCAQINGVQGKTVTAGTLLFTIDGSKEYAISSSASWLTITKNKTGIAIPNAVDVGFTVNTDGLAPGNYTASITATGTGSGNYYSPASYCINLTVDDAGSSPSAQIFEAEDATINKATIDTKHPGFTGSGFVDYLNNTGDYIEWSLNSNTGGKATLEFRYANGSFNNRPLKLEVNGVVVTASLGFPPTGGWDQWKTISVDADLQPGTNKIKLTAIGYNGANMDHLKWTGKAAPNSGMLEAELAFLQNVQVDAKHQGFTGTGFGDYINSYGDYIEWTIPNSNGGPAELGIRYANGSSNNRPLKLEVNGVVIASNLAFPPTGGWTNWNTITYGGNLTSGPNKIRLTAIGSSGPNIDHLQWKETPVLTTMGGRSESRILEEPNQQADQLKVLILPNPVRQTGMVLIKTDSRLPVEMILTDISGKVLRVLPVKIYNGGYLDFSVRDLSAGVYFLTAMQGENKITTRIVVQR